jgi:hypothetical protein
MATMLLAWTARGEHRKGNERNVIVHPLGIVIKQMIHTLVHWSRVQIRNSLFSQLAR